MADPFYVPRLEADFTKNGPRAWLEGHVDLKIELRARDRANGTAYADLVSVTLKEVREKSIVVKYFRSRDTNYNRPWGGSTFVDQTDVILLRDVVWVRVIE